MALYLEEDRYALMRSDNLADRSLHAIESTGNVQIIAYQLNGYRNA